ncbi:MAG: sigma 54-interacting transcriptional regulator [Opitutaceae bacterium]
MSIALFQGEDAPIVAALAEIPYSNPFGSRRVELERLALGERYKKPERFLMPGEPLYRLEGNLGELLARAEAVFAAARTRLGSRGTVPAKDRAVAEGLAHFIVFHRHARALDGLIAAAGAWEGDRPAKVSASRLFERCRRDLEEMLASPAPGIEAAGGAATWFALYYQIRRAWVHTYAFVRGGSPAIQSLRERIWQSIFTHDMRRYERSLHPRMGDITTLIRGPSGSGKELVAQAIGLSRFVPFDVRERGFAADPATSFHPLNLSALSPTLIESELFGHRRGAFTGALGDRTGFFETCGEHGTVFLDEIGETAPAIQVKLLRVLQTRQFNRLGETELRKFRGRVVAATNRDLAAEIEAGRFREDFFFRLCGDQIETPALRDILRGDPNELSCLVAHICAAQAGVGESKSLSAQVLDVIKRRPGLDYAWPGNFRELEQCVRNIVVHGSYMPPLAGRRDAKAASWLEEARMNRLTLDELLHEYCRQVADESGSLEEAARRLEADRRTVRRYLNLSLGEKPAV